MIYMTTMEEADALKKRFDGLKKDTGTGRAEFARLYSVPGGGSMIYQHITGRRPINMDAALAYAKGFRCNLNDISQRLAVTANEIAQGLPKMRVIDGESRRIDDTPAPPQDAGPPLSGVLQFKTTEPKSERDTWLDQLNRAATQLDLGRLAILANEASKLLAEMPAKQTPESFV